METKRITKQGISLIVLVVTIVVMLILSFVTIISIKSTNILNRAEKAIKSADLSNIRQIAQLAWADAYLDGKRTPEELNMSIIESFKKSGLTEQDINNLLIKVTPGNVEVEYFPVAWKKSVYDVVDSVPIPKGFVVSPYSGENNKDTGLVIYELNEGETDISIDKNQFESWTNRNQFVWVPVDSDNFENTFIRKSFVPAVPINLTSLGNDYWEVSPSIKLSNENLKYMTKETLKEVQDMYNSVKLYGGFYISRYEAGLNINERRKSDDGKIEENVYFRMNKAPYNYVGWSNHKDMTKEVGGAVQIARSIYPDNDTNTKGVISTLTYGVQWDRTLSWWQERKVKDINGQLIRLTFSKTYGNYTNSQIEFNTFNSGAQYSEDNGQNYQLVERTKGEENWLLTTGASTHTCVNNIYDMAGNLYEWVMEGRDEKSRVLRGGNYTYVGSSNHVAYRSTEYEPDHTAKDKGFRITLYIKTKDI